MNFSAGESRLNPTLRSGWPRRPRQPSHRRVQSNTVSVRPPEHRMVARPVARNTVLTFQLRTAKLRLPNACRAARAILTMKTIILVENDPVVIKVTAPSLSLKDSASRWRQTAWSP